VVEDTGIEICVFRSSRLGKVDVREGYMRGGTGEEVEREGSHLWRGRHRCGFVGEGRA